MYCKPNTDLYKKSSLQFHLVTKGIFTLKTSNDSYLINACKSINRILQALIYKRNLFMQVQGVTF